MKINLKVWRQTNNISKGKFQTYQVDNISEDMSFFEMLDMLNNSLIKKNETPIAFDHDCREGICGMCGAVVNGNAHGPLKESTLCQLHMRSFKDGDEIVLEPYRSKGLPVVKDLAVDRAAFDRIIQSGGFISARTGSAQDANAIPVSKIVADEAFDSATCIGCSACVAACPNASAMLFVSAKINHLGAYPQGQVEEKNRVLKMVRQMDKEGFGNCSNEYQCEVACPKGISVKNIAKMNKKFLKYSIS